MQKTNRIYITESQYKRIFKEAAFDDFNVEQLRQIKSLKGREQFCRRMLGKPIGRGSSRLVFQISDEKVLKLAMNRKGLAQNAAEADWGAQRYGVLPTLFEDDDNGWFIVTEYVLPAKEDDFEYCLGITFEEYCQFVIFAFNQYSRRKYQCSMENSRFQELLENSEWLEKLYGYLTDYQPPFGDLTAINNLGLCNRNGEAEIVILDSGLTNEIWNEYYSSRG